MKTLRKNILSQSLHILLGALILQQGFTFSLLSKSSVFNQDETFETCLIEILEWACREDIDLQFPSTADLPEPQQSSEEERSETELLEEKELIPPASPGTFLLSISAFSHNTFWLSSNFASRFTPPPELG